jgi:hypothetical protein
MTFSTSRALAPHDKKLFPEKRSPIKNTFSWLNRKYPIKVIKIKSKLQPYHMTQGTESLRVKMAKIHR